MDALGLVLFHGLPGVPPLLSLFARSHVFNRGPSQAKEKEKMQNGEAVVTGEHIGSQTARTSP